MRRAKTIVIALSAAAAIAGCVTPRKGLQPREGFVQVPGGRVWYRIVGSGTATPLLLVHGGPGASSLYLKPLEALADERPVIFYDQLGGGKSDRPKDQALWRMDRFVEELKAVRGALGLQDVHLFGHSFGTMVIADYLQGRPDGVRSVTFASPSLSIPRWVQDAKALLATLPPATQDAIERNERAGTTNTAEYQAALLQYYGRYLARRSPWSPEIQQTFAELNADVYGYMQGPSEFTITGTIKDYDRTPSLRNITIPTLFTAGQYDEARPETVKYYQSLVPGAALAIVADAGHMTMHDQPEKYVAVLRAFLREADARRRPAAPAGAY